MSERERERESHPHDENFVTASSHNHKTTTTRQLTNEKKKKKKKKYLSAEKKYLSRCEFKKVQFTSLEITSFTSARALAPWALVLHT